MMRSLHLLGCVLRLLPLMAAAPAPAWAQLTELPLRVVEISGADAYLSSGRADGVRPGTGVRFGSFARRVTRATRSFAVVAAKRLRVGARGVALVDKALPEQHRLPPPRPLRAFFGQWPSAALPATRQHPEPIALERFQRAGARIDAGLSAAAAAMIPMRGGPAPVGRAELRAQLRAALDTQVPIQLSADLALQKWLGRYAAGVASADARPLLFARELALRIGAADSYHGQLGRIRYAAASLGPIDGVRLTAARAGPVSVSGFGGLLPDPIRGSLDPNSGRFGVQLDLRDARRSDSPELTLVLHGSVFHGRLDERRVYARGQLWPGAHRVAVYAQASMFDRANPWGRPRLDLNAAGADADLRFGAVNLSARIDMRRPERSYWLANAFDATWLCSSSARAASAARACPGTDDTRYVAQAALAWRGALLAAQADATWVGSSEPTLGNNALLHAGLRTARPLAGYDFGLSGSFERGSLLQANLGLRADVGVSLAAERVRLNLYYRPAYRLYTASIGAFWEQGAGIGLHISASSALSFDLQGDTRLGDVDALLAMFLLRYQLSR